MTTPLTPTEIEEALNLAKDYDTLITDAFIQTHAALEAAQEALGLLYQFKFSLAHEEDRDVVERAFNQLITTKEE